MYGTCQLQRTQGSKLEYWVKYQCVYDPNNPGNGTLMKYEYAVNDMCMGEETDIVDFDPQIINDWCCSLAIKAGGGLVPDPDPTSFPTNNPSKRPSQTPTKSPTILPTASPSDAPTNVPSIDPTVNPTIAPTAAPTIAPTPSPTATPTVAPTNIPTNAPTHSPTNLPTVEPTTDPTRKPSMYPTTWAPTKTGETRPPTPSPTPAPTQIPTNSPTDVPSTPPTDNPTVVPTKDPSLSPTKTPTVSTAAPTTVPTVSPTHNPTTKSPTLQPSYAPTTTHNPTLHPTFVPSVATTQSERIINSDAQGSESSNEDTANNSAQSRVNSVSADAMPGIPVHAICLLIVVVVFGCTMYEFIKKSKSSKKDIRWSLKIPVIISFLANIVGIACIVILSTIMITAERWDITTYERVLVPYKFASIAYIVSKMGLETFFILRAYQGFKKSAFAVSKFTLFVLFAWMLIVAGVWFFFLPAVVNVEVIFDESYYVILSAMDAVFMVCLLLIFTKKLNELVLLHRTQTMADLSTMMEIDDGKSQPSTHGQNESQATADPTQKNTLSLNDNTSTSDASIARPSTTQISASTDLGELRNDAIVNLGRPSTLVDAVQKSLTSRQTRWIFVITRCIILNCVAFCTTIVFGFLAFYYLRNAAPLYVLYSSWSVDMLINSVCLYLNFAFSTPLYNRLCVCCHRQCQRLMEYCAARQILREHTADLKVQSEL
mmetsp:Transcript_48107/g.79743  ORF Transcript_48107/g.79743 Transcript_48107/m.79743 type:complete len:712 (+) Transcript_48107:1-2136(+)